MEIEDKLGQKTTLVFSKTQRNAVLPADAFAFQSPPGADVIGTPVP
jgi:outer membrane lipoprotein-sorting protein